jgi:hypothetical protein
MYILPLLLDPTKFPINSAIIWDTVLDDKLIEWYADIMRGHHVV